VSYWQCEVLLINAVTQVCSALLLVHGVTVGLLSFVSLGGKRVHLCRDGVLACHCPVQRCHCPMLSQSVPVRVLTRNLLIDGFGPAACLYCPKTNMSAATRRDVHAMYAENSASHANQQFVPC
jgi:hypothetical protein